MKRYCLKSRNGNIEYFDILSEEKEVFKVILTRIHNGNEKITETFITRDLFELCQKTGYIYELNKVA